MGGEPHEALEDRAAVVKPARAPSELAIRAVSSLVMIALALAVAWYGSWGWALASAAVIAVCAWEWTKMAGTSRRYTNVAVLIAALCGAGFVLGPELVQVASCVVLAGTLALASQRGGSVGVVGAGYIALAGYAFASLRVIGVDGQFLILMLFAIVWSTDSAAYFAGRTFGGPRLWPRVSPKKTWSGFVGGCLAAVISACCLAAIWQASVLAWGIAGLLVCVAAQAGDLLESSAKRHFGVKDSNTIIPGHGGVLDRIDGHLSAALAISVLVSIPGLRGWLL